MICNKCRSRSDDSANYCQNCGARLPVFDPQAVKLEPVWRGSKKHRFMKEVKSFSLFLLGLFLHAAASLSPLLLPYLFVWFGYLDESTAGAVALMFSPLCLLFWFLTLDWTDWGWN